MVTAEALGVHTVAYPGGAMTAASPTGARGRLRRADWERAALAAIARGGLAAVAVEPLARELGVTKGSFYAHFATRDALLEAALGRWEAEHGAQSLAGLAGDGPPAARLRALVDAAVAFAGGAGPSPHLALLGETHDPRVRAALRRVDASRMAYLASLYRELGLPPARAGVRAQLAYATFRGLVQLARDGEAAGRTARARRALAREVAAALIPPARPST
jgi:AcrR family transcriptional regulator